MDERELQALVGMATEAEGLDIGPASRHARDRAGERRLGWWIAGVAAGVAACLGVGVFTWLTWSPPLPVPGPRLAGGGAALEPRGSTQGMTPVASSAVDPWVVLAIYRGWDGECRCLHVERPPLVAQKPLEAIRPSELLAMGLESACAATVERLIVLGISGPAEELPTTKDEAEVVAACLDAAGSEDPSLMARQAESCLPAGVTVVAELLEVRRPPGFR